MLYSSPILYFFSCARRLFYNFKKQKIIYRQSFGFTNFHDFLIFFFLFIISRRMIILQPHVFLAGALLLFKKFELALAKLLVLIEEQCDCLMFCFSLKIKLKPKFLMLFLFFLILFFLINKRF